MVKIHFVLLQKGFETITTYMKAVTTSCLNLVHSPYSNPTSVWFVLPSKCNFSLFFWYLNFVGDFEAVNVGHTIMGCVFYFI